MGLANITISLRVHVDHVVESYDHFHIHVFIRVLMHVNMIIYLSFLLRTPYTCNIL